MSDTFEWHCDFCGSKQVVTTQTLHRGLEPLRIGKSKYEEVGLWFEAIRCANPSCNEVSLQVSLDQGDWRSPSGYFRSTQKLQRWRLRPSSSARPQPEYIPAPIVSDYYEACAIRDLSPKASATLSRRCLQGMIRDFAGISKGRLIDEIAELRKRIEAGSAPRGVEVDTLEAIDHVREIGNIGAHMEKDINVIVDVDPGEAQVLIELLEMLFSEWYVARENRSNRLSKLQEMAATKGLQKKGPRPEGENSA